MTGTESGQHPPSLKSHPSDSVLTPGQGSYRGGVCLECFGQPLWVPLCPALFLLTQQQSNIPLPGDAEQGGEKICEN